MNFNFNESTSRTVKHDGHKENKGKDFHFKNVVYFACTVPHLYLRFWRRQAQACPLC